MNESDTGYADRRDVLIQKRGLAAVSLAIEAASRSATASNQLALLAMGQAACPCSLVDM